MAQVYADADQFRALFGLLFSGIEESDPDGMDPLIEEQMVICFAVRKPDVEMWVDGRAKPIVTSFGPNDVPATLTAKLTGNTLHELLLGSLPLGKALWRRRLKVKGSKTKAMRLESLLHACQAAYPDLAEEQLGT